MNSNRAGLWIGIALVVAGLAALVRNFVPWWMQTDFLWGTAFLVLAGAVFVSHRQHPRRGLPLLGWGLVGVAAALLLNAAGGTYGDLAGAAFLLAVAVGFFSLHTRQAENWWPALVGGVLFVLAALSAVASLDLLEGDQQGFLFFFGLALVFLYLYAIRTPENRLDWARFPAVGCLAVAALILVTHIVPDLEPYFWPTLLILVGSWFVWRDLRRRRVTPAPETAGPGEQKGEQEPEAEGRMEGLDQS